MPVDRTRQRYNAKARQSTVGGSSHKKKGKRKAKDTQDHDVQEENPNAEIVVPKSSEQKELDRKEKLRQELFDQQNSKASSKKKKRLEKYIDKKLKQDERVEIFEKLSKSQAQLSTTLQLQSSATLGTGKASTHKDMLDKQEDKEVRRALDGMTRKGKRGQGKQNILTSYDAESEGEDSMRVDGEPANQDTEGDVGTSRANPVVIVDSGFSTAKLSPGETPAAVAHAVQVGSALKRTADGSAVAPKISKRKPKGSKTAFASWKTKGSVPEATNDDSDTSFDSSDSAYDPNESDDGEDVQSQADGDQDGASEWSGIHDSAESSGAEENDPEGDASQSDGEDSGDGSTADASQEEPAPPAKRKLGFKEWALQQLSSVKDYVAPVAAPSESATLPTTPDTDSLPPPAKKRKTGPPPTDGLLRGPLGENLQLPATTFSKAVQQSAEVSKERGSALPRKVVEVTRAPEVQESRLMLPIVAEEQPIMEAILLNSVVVICGETGSGKTTQVPQFLYEAGFGSPGSDNPGMIGVTQPRRVAAMSMASRVAHELALPPSRVSYQIRYDATVAPTTSVKFMTDGVLLRELAADFLLRKYSVIIIDEAHERSMNTDILIGVLSRVVKLREEMWREGKDGAKPLRLIIMSATLRVSDFAENKTLFSTPPPIIHIPARQHPVTVHFSRRTASDYVSEAVKKASKIHARLPPGGILIFLTGQNEISGVCRKLEARYGANALEARRKMRAAKARTQEREPREEGFKSTVVAPAQADVEAEDLDLGEQEALALDVDGEGGPIDDDPEALDSDDDEDEKLGIDTEESDVPMHIVPLYALLPSEKQMQVFKPPPPGHRLVVVSTNVAETSLTIPDIRYVVDSGRAKERRYDVANGVQAFQVSWISKASAAQRAGRAGRTGPGHCYRLYSSALFEHYFEQFAQPEILRVPIEGVVLQMKSMNIDAVVNFPFPTPPDRTSLRKAETVLTYLGALAPPPGGSLILGGGVTEIGKAMSLFPLSPRYSRMLVSGRQHGCLPYVITVVSILSVGDPFLREEVVGNAGDESEDEADEELSHLTSEAAKAKEARRLRRRAYFRSQQTHTSLGNSSSDVFKMLSVVGAYEYAGGGHSFCSEHFVRPKAMEEIHKLRAQISSIVQTNFPELETGFVANLKPPSALQLKVLRQLLTAGFIDQVAVRKDLMDKGSASGDKFTTSKGVPYRAMGIADDVYIHPSSVLYSNSPPDYVVFLEVVQTSRIWMKGLTVVNGAWLSSLGKSLCTFSKPIKTKDGRTVVIPHFGPAGWELPPIESH
ncbi:P-loop containing nucleoside triphosphate hydrolase protein [Rhodofomes roseus]|uniref:P-loop containing nucleoside triphosphate hydrolase protein n=1 Tax=Rhodofomes roseus TaxID=34475 RepID=A0ABQ8KTZ1_9APHY|nr:P-loop containing nucleoside triphosphate hydrolase protein [Rhodofomes roseus]KAH9841541.1 P-loop containing nucleoside triphosphate hydrolase protein [Rhodofomes roseus]